MTETARIGLFVCECGDKIAGALDVRALVERGRALPGVVWAGRKGYWCLPGGVELMRATVAAQQLDRAVIAGCAPRAHDPSFR
jgi:heterodisulfide reductase subunit A